ncbi:MAG: hypothetical protein HZB57_10520 [Gammaproteobacteria bacterium]|nr:hypothetical protein [Gammaproteobacteria bacterium]
MLGIIIWRQRRSGGGTRIQYIDATEEYPTPSLYLDSEAAKTQTFVEALRTQPKAAPGDPALRAALGLRAGLLRQESELAQSLVKTPVGERDPALWVVLAQQVAAVVGAEGFSRQAQKGHEVYGEDTGPSEVIADQQTRTIQHLREYIQQLLEKLGHQPLPDANMTEHFDTLERANRELNQCVTVLEDENSFLRDQIAALLKLDHTSGEA